MHYIEVKSSNDKRAAYELLIIQIIALCEGEPNITANLANISAAIKQTFNWWWVGFYLVEGEELILGPFQGPVACTRISKGKGVCGTSWEKMETIMVDDVDKFPGHIACSSESRSEIVIPLIYKHQVIGVLDIDSEKFASFDDTDKLYLEKLSQIISDLFMIHKFQK